MGRAHELFEMLAELDEGDRALWIDPFTQGQDALDRLAEAMRCAATEGDGGRQD